MLCIPDFQFHARYIYKSASSSSFSPPSVNMVCSVVPYALVDEIVVREIVCDVELGLATERVHKSLSLNPCCPFSLSLSPLEIQRISIHSPYRDEI